MMPILIDSNTRICMSLSQKPGNFGNLFHNFLYRELNLNYIYKSFAVEDLENAIRGIRALNITGCGVSMPYKKNVIRFLDEIDPIANSIGAVNTILNNGATLKGFNTDYCGVFEVFRKYQIPVNSTIALLGSGGMAGATIKALFDLGFKNVTVVSRNVKTGQNLASLFGFAWKKEFDRRDTFDVLINATPIGMGIHNSDEMPFEKNIIDAAQYICDVVQNPIETGLLKYGKQTGKKVISGFEITCVQAREQFKLYTGIIPSDSLVLRAIEFCSSS